MHYINYIILHYNGVFNLKPQRVSFSEKDKLYSVVKKSLSLPDFVFFCMFVALKYFRSSNKKLLDNDNTSKLEMQFLNESVYD